MSFFRTPHNDSGKTPTGNPLILSLKLYQLSYCALLRMVHCIYRVVIGYNFEITLYFFSLKIVLVINRGGSGSRISGKGVHMYKGVCVCGGGGGGVRFADFFSFFL